MPFDLDALKREAAGEPFEFTFGGEDYQLPAQPDIDVLAAAAASEGRLDVLLRRLLGEDQWKRMLASSSTFTADLLEALMGAYGEFLGVDDVGNSSASPSFYKSTVAPSKRTSSGRIKSA